MRTLITALALSGIAAAPLAARAQEAPAPPSVLAQLIAAGTHLSIIGPDGRPVAQLVPIGNDVYRLRIIGTTRDTGRAARDAGTLRIDDTHALTPQQLEAAHQRALETVIPTPSFGP